MIGILCAVVIPVVLFSQAENAWGRPVAVVVAGVGAVLGYLFAAMAIPYLLIGMIARETAMRKALRSGDDAPRHEA